MPASDHPRPEKTDRDPVGPGDPEGPETAPGRAGRPRLRGLRELVDDCVHCGMCLPHCPTYQLWGQEMDSPRGRIHLIGLGLAGEIAVDQAFRRHIDACLGCLACQTACPSGVQYEPLLEATRARLERDLPRPARDGAYRRLLLAVLPRRGLLRLAGFLAWVYQRLGVRWLVGKLGLRRRLPGAAAALDGLLPDVRLADLVTPFPMVWPAAGHTRMRVGLVTGCVQAVFFRRVGQATARVLAAEGCEVVAPPTAGCCGALALHAGHDDAARDRARALIAAFEDHDIDRIVVDAAGCGATLAHYDRLLADDPDWAGRAARFAARVRDVFELLDEIEPRAPRAPVPGRVAYHDACHLAHARGIRAAPRRALTAIPGLDLVEIPSGDTCCGSAGLYNLTEPDAAEELGRRKAGNIRSVAPEVVAAANPGCLLQLRRHLAGGDPEAGPEIRLVHPIELVAASIDAGADADSDADE